MKRFPEAAEPPLHRKDVRERVAHALHYARRISTPTEVPNLTLANHLGPQSRQVGKWLRYHLFQIDRDYFAGDADKKSFCRLISAREDGIKHVKKRLTQHTQPGKRAGNGVTVGQPHQATPESRPCNNGVTVEHRLSLHYQAVALPAGVLSPSLHKRVVTELASARFLYAERSSRLTHPLQSLPRKVKQTFWEQHGLPYDYDISSCAPTVLLQLARREQAPAILFSAVADYLADKHPLQARVMELLEVDEVSAKRFINGLFNGATLARTSYCSAYREFGEAKVKALQQDRQVFLLRRAVSRMWTYIQKREGSLRGCKKKAAVYRREERKIIEVVRAWLDERGIKHFLEHDGWRTSEKIDVAALEQVIKQHTNYEVTIK